MARLPPSRLNLDASWVAGRLFQGGYPPLDGRVRKAVDVVVFAASELQPPAKQLQGVKKIFAPNDDDGCPMAASQWRIASAAAAQVRYHLDRGKRVLVTCHAGLNRSGLISALAMMLPPSKGARCSDTPYCCSSGEAISMVRAARGEYALSNSHFVRALTKLDGKLCPGRKPTFLPVHFR